MESIYWYVILASGAIIIITLGGLTIYYRNNSIRVLQNHD